MLIYPKANVDYPIRLEREYAKMLVRYTRDVRKICLEFVPLLVDEAIVNGITTDRMDNWITDMTSKIKEIIESKLRIRDKVTAMFDKVKDFAKRQQEKIFRGVFGSTPNGDNTRQYEIIKTIWVSQNLELIKSIDRRTMEQIHYALGRNVIRTVDREMLIKELTQSIMQMGKVNERRAALIASDQVGKLNSQLAQYEQINQGVDSYIWSTRRDSRVRKKHREREGRVFKWGNPPDDGHPGWPVRCRCVAVPAYNTNKIGMKPKAGSYKEVGKDNGVR
jgi:SPP1 gp7 family putative phage head morphogenesis protein